MSEEKKEVPEEAFASFMGVTGVDRDTAAFFLESADGNVEAATDAYFSSTSGSSNMRAFDRRPEGGGFPRMHMGSPTDRNSSNPSTVGGQAPRPPVPEPHRGGQPRQQPPPPPQPAPAARGPPGRSNIGNFADILKRKEEEEEGARKGQNQGYFSGHGSGQAGTEILDPEDEARKRFLDHAKRMQDEYGNADRGSAPPPGRRLGDVSSVPAPEPKKWGEVEIHLFSDGFTVGRDGPLRKMTDPSNAHFLEQLHAGRAPAELEVLAGTPNVEVKLVQHEDKWSPPEKKSGDAPRELFSGQGRTLGGGGSSGGSAAAQVPEEILDPSAVISVDDSLPTTKIQIRFANGKREVVTLNPSKHTVGDVKTYVSCVVDGAPFELIGPDRQPLENDGDTIEAAKLQRSLLHHKAL